MVVLDVSSSVRPTTYFRIEQTLNSIAASKGRLGLVLFSDVAYEALPTGTPASELGPSSASSRRPRRARVRRPTRHTWRTARGSSGSRRARKSRAGCTWQSTCSRRSTPDAGAVLLISDLADDPEDSQALKNSVVLLEQKAVPLEIVALAPTIANANYFKSLLGSQAIYQTAHLPTGAQAAGKIEVTSGFSIALALFALVAVLLLALDEWWTEPFRFTSRPS